MMDTKSPVRSLWGDSVVIVFKWLAESYWMLLILEPLKAGSFEMDAEGERNPNPSIVLLTA
jgi:hypothetical protein